ncbi:hypothetical protein [Vibrio furnissii]|uniref:hypothetical protein n=1 Tax=Vibrio furnissii TaxID=29494 RepID=UPI001EEC86B9|nr:hypothetical protein [Vibrio furnissii]
MFDIKDDDLDISFDMSLFDDYVDDKKRHLRSVQKEHNEHKSSFTESFNRFSEYKCNPHSGLIMVGLLDSAGNGIGDANAVDSFGLSQQRY